VRLCRDARDGVAFLTHHPLLRTVALLSAVLTLTDAAWFSILVLLVTDASPDGPQTRAPRPQEGLPRPPGLPDGRSRFRDRLRRRLHQEALASASPVEPSKRLVGAVADRIDRLARYAAPLQESTENLT
jgi:hypothetical protein